MVETGWTRWRAHVGGVLAIVAACGAAGCGTNTVLPIGSNQDGAAGAQDAGFDGAGDFFMDGEGRLTMRGEASSAPYAYMGVKITKPQIVDGEDKDVFSLTPIWRRFAAEGRLFGSLLEGQWMHVGDPAARIEAEARLAAGRP